MRFRAHALALVLVAFGGVGVVHAEGLGHVRVTKAGQQRTLALDSVLGAGGVGVVYRAHDVGAPEQHFAVKVLRAAHRGNPLYDTLAHEHGVLEAMELHDKGFPKAHGLGEMLDGPDRGPAFAMELLPGRPLGGAGPGLGWDNPRKLVPGKAVRVARTLLGQLSALHAAGYVHGDVHTGNTTINDELHSWSAKLLDYGTSKPYSAGGAQGDTENTARILLQNLTGLSFSDPRAITEANQYRANVSGRTVTLGAVLRSAMAGDYKTPAALDEAIAPFAAMAP